MTAFCRPEWLVLKPCEQYYRRLYEAHPDYYFYDQGGILFTDWKDFRKQYQQRSKGNEVIPEDPPTALGPELIENTFFANSTKDVSVVFNARYCPPFWHHLCFVKIMYVLHGEIQINISQTKSVILKKGNFLISPPNVKQSVFSYHDDDVVVNVFLRATTFEQSFSSLLSNADVLSEFFWRILYGKDESSILWFQIEPDSKLDSMILAITDAALDASQESSFFLTSQVMAFLGEALYHHRNSISSIADTVASSDSFPAIIQYVYEHYNTITLSELSKVFHKSEAYMSRYIKQETGVTLSHIVQQRRLKQAALMLRNTHFTIEEIMYEVGYTDISHFYKAFKKQYDMTPLQYRNKRNIILL